MHIPFTSTKLTLLKFVTTSILHFHLTPVVTARLHLIKYISYHRDEFKHQTVAYLMALASYIIALMVEILSLYLVIMMTDAMAVISNFI